MSSDGKTTSSSSGEARDTTVPKDVEAAAKRRALSEALVEKGWPGTKIIRVLKDSQNTTYEGQLPSGEQVAVRCVPLAGDTPVDVTLKRVQTETALLQHLQRHAPDVSCSFPLPTTDGRNAVFITNVEEGVELGDTEAVAIVVSEWARGRPVDIPSNEWMTDRRIVFAQGAWLAQFHLAAQQLPEPIAANVQPYTAVHNNLMVNVPISDEDKAMMQDPTKFGVTHGDVNCSNYFIIESGDACGAGKGDEEASATPSLPFQLSVFDRDQAQRAWFMYDLALAIFGVVLRQEGTNCEIKNVPAFTQWLVEGYESVAGEGIVDRPHLARMVALRREFYVGFGKREVVERKLPPGMTAFCDFIVEYGKKTEGKPIDLGF